MTNPVAMTVGKSILREFGPPIVNAFVRRIVKAFDEEAEYREELKRRTKKEFATGQEHLVRVEEAEEAIRCAQESNNEDVIRHETENRKFWLEEAKIYFAEAANVHGGIKRAYAYYYLGLCLAKLGSEGAAEREFRRRAKPVLISIRNELLNNGPRTPGIATAVIGFCFGGGAFWLFGGLIPAVVVGAAGLLLSVLVMAGVNPRDADLLVEVCALGRRIAPDDPVADWTVPEWALKKSSKKGKVT